MTKSDIVHNKKYYSNGRKKNIKCSRRKCCTIIWVPQVRNLVTTRPDQHLLKAVLLLYLTAPSLKHPAGKWRLFKWNVWRVVNVSCCQYHHCLTCNGSLRTITYSKNRKSVQGIEYCTSIKLTDLQEKIKIKQVLPKFDSEKAEATWLLLWGKAQLILDLWGWYRYWYYGARKFR